MQPSHPDYKSPILLLEKLKGTGQDYELLERISDESVAIRFVGRFNDMQVVWDARITTLQYKCRETQSDVAHIGEPCRLRQSIDICENSDGYNIDIALNLARIDEAAIKRTIIMIRKYKRLHIGHHEYGEAITLKPD